LQNNILKTVTDQAVITVTHTIKQDGWFAQRHPRICGNAKKTRESPERPSSAWTTVLFLLL